MILLCSILLPINLIIIKNNMIMNYSGPHLLYLLLLLLESRQIVPICLYTQKKKCFY